MGTRTIALKMPFSPRTFQNGLLLRRPVMSGFESGMRYGPIFSLRPLSRTCTDDCVGR
jgi:hypothetical protein